MAPPNAVPPVAQPNPVRVVAATPAERETAAVLRNVNCAHYTQCIGTAIRKGWEGFACTSCPLESRAPRLRAEDFLRRTNPLLG